MNVKSKIRSQAILNLPVNAAYAFSKQWGHYKMELIMTYLNKDSVCLKVKRKLLNG